VRQGEKQTPVAAEVSRYLGAGLTWVLATMLFLVLGRAADGWLGTDPWLALVGAFVGAAAGFYSMLRQLQKPQKRGDGSGEAGGEAGSGERDRRS